MSNEVPGLASRASSQARRLTDKGNIKEMKMIKLLTDLENAIGFREHYRRLGDHNLYAMWDEIIDSIIDKINLENEHGTT
jgi:hypothetical protein